jgi:hypothetical protein
LPGVEILFLLAPGVSGQGRRPPAHGAGLTGACPNARGEQPGLFPSYIQFTLPDVRRLGPEPWAQRSARGLVRLDCGGDAT